MVQHTIAVDWLEVNLKAQYPTDFDGIEEKESADGKTLFRRTGNGNKFYKNHFEILHNNKKLATFLCNSRSEKLLAGDNFQLKVENNKLYELGWLDDLKSIMHEQKWKYRSATRLDIALDGGKYFDVFEKWRAGAYDKVGKAKITTHYTGKRTVEGYYIGMSKSKKKLVCYNKSDEIKRTNKKYIQKFWERCGLNTSQKVERLELRLRNEENKKIPDMDFNSLDNFEHLASLLQTNMLKFFEFVKVDNQKNISRKERIQPINWQSIGGQMLDKNSTRNTSEIWAGKITCKKLYEVYICTGKKSYYDMAFDFAFNCDSVEWFIHCQKDWKHNIEKKLGKNKDGEIKHNWVTQFTEYNEGEQILISNDKSKYSPWNN